MTFTPTHLGKTSPIENDPNKVVLDLIPNPHPLLMYCARFCIPEFTSRCPVTGAPDFATLIIDYVPKKWLVESKSLKLWMYSFREHGAFHEDCTMSIGARLNMELEPRWLRIAGFWYARGGISIDVTWQSGEQPKDVAILDLNAMKPYLGRVS